MYKVPKYLPSKYSLVTKGKRITSMKKPGKHHLQQGIKVNINGANQNHVPLDKTQ